MTLAERARSTARPERPEPGLEPGDDPGLRPRERDGDGQPAQPDRRCSSTPARRLTPRSTPAPCRTPRPPRRCSRGTSPTPACSPRRPTPTPPTRSSRKRPRKLNYDPTPDLQLPAHPDRLQLVHRLGPRRAGHALVERGQRAGRRQPGRGPDAGLGHPGAVRPGDAVAESGPAADPVDVPGQLPDGGLHPGRHADGRPGERPAAPVRDRIHYWFQFDAGSGMPDADPLMAGATIGQTFTTATGTFTEVPDALREKTTIQLNAEITGSPQRPGWAGSQ